MGKIFHAPGSSRPHIDRPRNLHGQSNQRFLSQARKKSDPHIGTLSIIKESESQEKLILDTTRNFSDQSKKMIALFFGVLVLSNEFLPLVRDRYIHSSERSSKKRLSPSHAGTNKTAQKTLYERTITQIANVGTLALGSLILGPWGKMLFFPYPQTKASVTSTRVLLEGTQAEERVLALSNSARQAEHQFNEFAQRNPKTALSLEIGGGIVASALIGGAFGAGAGIFAEASTVTVESEALLTACSSIKSSLVSLVVGETLHSLPEAERYLHNSAKVIIQEIAPLLRAVSPSMSVEESENAAAAGFSAFLKISSYIPNNFGKALLKGTTISTISHSAKDTLSRSGKVLHSAGSYVKKSIKKGLKDGFKESFSEDPLEETRRFSSTRNSIEESEETPFEKLFSQTVQEMSNYTSPFLESANRALQQEWEKARKQIKNGSPTETKLSQVTEEDSYPAIRENFISGFQAAAALATLSGNKQLAHTLLAAGPAMIQVMDSFNRISKAASTTASAAITGSSFGPWGALAAGLLSLFALSEESNSSQEIATFLMKMYQNIQEMMQTLFDTLQHFRTEVLHELHSLRDQFTVLQYYTLLNFFRLTEEVHDVQALQAYYSHDILQHLDVFFDILNSKIDTLLLEKRFKACSDIRRYTTTQQHILEAMSERDVTEFLSPLEDGLRTDSQHPITLPNRNFNGALCTKFSPEFINKNLGRLSPGDLLGYFMNLLKQKYGLISPIQGDLLPNIKLYLHESAHYLSLRMSLPPHIHYDEDRTILSEVAQGGQDIILTVEWLQKNASVILEKLKTQYDTTVAKFHTLFIEALENEVTKTLENALASIPLSQRLPDLSNIRFSLLDSSVSDMIDKVLDNRPLNDVSFPRLDEPRVHDNLCLDTDPAYVHGGCVPLQLSRNTLEHSYDSTKSKGIVMAPIVCLAERMGIIQLAFRHMPSLPGWYECMRYPAPNTHVHCHGQNYVTGYNIEAKFKVSGATPREFSATLGLLTQADYDDTIKQRFLMPFTAEKAVQLFEQSPPYFGFMFSDSLENGDLNKVLIPIIQSTVKKMRSRAVASLYAPGTRGVLWQETIAELEAIRNEMRTFLLLIGLPQEVIEHLNLWNGNPFAKAHDEFIKGNIDERIFRAPPSTDRHSKDVFSWLIEGVGQINGPEESPLIAPIFRLLSLFGQFSLRKASSTQETEIPIKPLSFQERIDRLEHFSRLLRDHKSTPPLLTPQPPPTTPDQTEPILPPRPVSENTNELSQLRDEIHELHDEITRRDAQHAQEMKELKDLLLQQLLKMRA